MKWLLLLLIVPLVSASWATPYEAWSNNESGHLMETSQGLMVSNTQNLLVRDQADTIILPPGTPFENGIISGTTVYNFQGEKVATLPMAAEAVNGGFITLGTKIQQFLPAPGPAIDIQNCDGQPFAAKGTGKGQTWAAVGANQVSVYIQQQFEWSIATGPIFDAFVADKLYVVLQNGTVEAYSLQGSCNQTPQWTQTNSFRGTPTNAAFSSQLFLTHHFNSNSPQEGTIIVAIAPNGTESWLYRTPELFALTANQEVVVLGYNRTEILSADEGRVLANLDFVSSNVALGNALYLSGTSIRVYTSEPYLGPMETEVANGASDSITIPAPFAPLALLLLRRFYK